MMGIPVLPVKASSGCKRNHEVKHMMFKKKKKIMIKVLTMKKASNL